MEGWYNIFGKEAELPTMVYFECPYPVLEKRILSRAKYSGRTDDNTDSLKLRFDTYKAETLPTVEFFKNKNKCVDVDSSADRESVYQNFSKILAGFTEAQYVDAPLSEKAEILLGLRPYF